MADNKKSAAKRKKNTSKKKQENNILKTIKQKFMNSADENQEGDYKKKIRRHKGKMLIRTGSGVAAAALLIFLIWIWRDNHCYRNYKVTSTSNQEDTVSANYNEFNGNILKYTSESASLLSLNQENLWTVTYEMQSPFSNICGNTMVIADKGGTNMVVLDKNGQIGSITTNYNILNAKVASQGVVAAILDGGEDTWINFYALDGSLIAENQTRIDDPGYPLDIDVSPDGDIIMVSYQFVSGGKTTSNIAFYNFGTAGQSKIDNIVSAFEYDGVVVPQVEYLSNDTAIAFRDDGFVLYKGKQIPKEQDPVTVEKEIISTFHDETHIGLVFKDDEEEDKLYKMRVYDTKGNITFERSFNIEYTDIKMTDGYIVMYNSSQACVVNGRGKEKFNGMIDEGIVKDFFKVGWNKYMLVLDNGVSVIELK